MAINDCRSERAAETLRIFRRESPVTVLGPGRRAVVWVQGCPFACRGCIVPESWPFEGGETVPLNDLAAWILAQPGIEGITFSGGEPMEQAAQISLLIDRVRAQSDLGVVCYTGYRLEKLQQGLEGQQALLARTDLLIDGVYSESNHGDFRWRGSANQRLLPLSDRYRADVAAIASANDTSAGMEFFVDEQGAFGFAGIPAQPGFRREFESRLAGLGVNVS